MISINTILYFFSINFINIILSNDIEFDNTNTFYLTSSDEIQKAISYIGYDTEKYRAEDEVYEELHYCCQYERKPKK